MRRITTVLLLLFFAAAASGVLQVAHLLEHQSGRAAVVRSLQDHTLVEPVGSGHDEGRCALCAVSHMPVVAGSVVPLLDFLGLFVALLTLLALPLVSERLPARVDCRGPPTL